MTKVSVSNNRNVHQMNSIDHTNHMLLSLDESPVCEEERSQIKQLSTFTRVFFEISINSCLLPSINIEQSQTLHEVVVGSKFGEHIS